MKATTCFAAPIRRTCPGAKAGQLAGSNAPFHAPGSRLRCGNHVGATLPSRCRLASAQRRYGGSLPWTARDGLQSHRPRIAVDIDDEYVTVFAAAFSSIRAVSWNGWSLPAATYRG
jgi:hypothetical protein